MNKPKKGLNLSENMFTAHNKIQDLSVTLAGLDVSTLQQIEKFVISNPPFAAGLEGEVYKVPITTHNELKYFLVAKKRKDKDVSEEFKHHKFACDILKKEKELTTYVAVPTLHGKRYSVTQDDEYIIMDYVVGKTLFTKIVEQYTGNIYEDDTHALRDIKKYIYEKEGVDIPEEVALYEYLDKKLEKGLFKIFDEKTGETLKFYARKVIELFHKHNLYHRDMAKNLRNIIIGDDGKLYIIDFGKAKQLANYEEEKDIYVVDTVGNHQNRIVPDEALLSTIDFLTRKRRAPDPRELRY